MSDLPENFNLQVIKREPSPPSTPEDRSPHDIKAKLKMHLTCRHGNNQDDTESSQPANQPQQSKDRLKEVRQKRPYHKRADKTIKLPSASSVQQTSDNSTTPQRKYKSKFKQVVTTDSQDDNSMHAASVVNAGAISGDEDEGGHDNDLRSGGREKEKCPDVLAMVLSMKKRALMQDPEVQQFLTEVMNVIKS